MDIKVLIFSDVHHGIMPDACQRMEAIAEVARQNGADCLICLGDSAWDPAGHRIMSDIWNSISLPHYMVLGNHDMDGSSKQEVMDYYGMPANYYSFDVSGLHFIALDTNYFRKKDGGEEAYDYDHSNYYGQITDSLPQTQLDWLAQDLEQTDNPCILLSHAPLYDNGDPSCFCKNSSEIHEILLRHNRKQGWNQAFLSCNGHTHVDNLVNWDGIHYLEINSASNQWLGEEYAVPDPKAACPDPQDEPYYSCLRTTAPFRDPVYALLTFSPEKQTVSVQALPSSFIGPHPKERGHSGYWGDVPLTAGTAARNFGWQPERPSIL